MKLSPSGATFCLALPRLFFVPTDSEWKDPQYRNQPAASVVQKHDPDSWDSFQCLLQSHTSKIISICVQDTRGFSAASFQKALKDQVDEKNKNKSKPVDKSVTQRFDSVQERALQGADCKVTDRGFHFTRCHYNLSVPVLQCQDRSLIQRGMKKEENRRNNYTAQGMKCRKGKEHLFKCLAVCSTENFHSQIDVPDGRGKKAR